jgi:hypothetical protein
MARPPARGDFTKAEWALVTALRTPEHVQEWLMALPYNHEVDRETYRSFRGVVKHQTAHCLEAALSAAVLLEQHGLRPQLLDLESSDRLDHVLFLFQRDGLWGTVGASRDAGLHGRKPVFPSLRALVDSYAAPYVSDTARITAYGVLDLRRFRRDWRLPDEDVDWVVDELIAMPHKRFRMAEAEFCHFRARHLRFQAERREPGPMDFPGRRAWLAGPTASGA